MGGSKRYGDHYARLTDDRIEEFVMREELIMLTSRRLPGTSAGVPVGPLPFQSHPGQAHTIVYTRTAVKIRFLEPLIKIQREGWVWLGAVTPADTEGHE